MLATLVKKSPYFFGKVMSRLILKRIKIPLLDGQYHVLEVKGIFLTKLTPLPTGIRNQIDLQISFIHPFKVYVEIIHVKRFQGDFELYESFENACKDNILKHQILDRKEYLIRNRFTTNQNQEFLSHLLE
ncbi:hypothetical protein [Flectobacillus sp. BAB-3569]|uniref:hypothetical protein n=1 Tax=Flectobacillus sp. BAB-3569 TaxID=1509483 RepID=UPI001595D227|nr:hypothetical protein [Flectobacillus sp. BAB-3569]